MKKLLFFNKDGYPHNFQYNESLEKWEGKILFDENSDQTFKTQSLHLFESVDPINFTFNANLINNNYYNNSGLTIVGETKYQKELITNIQKVNESEFFYSKWIYGNEFHKKYPVGTIVSFDIIGSGTSIDDFSINNIFTVLSVKNNAFLILTKTNNKLFDFSFTSGYLKSLNVISINDYNRNLSNDSFFDLYDKKFSIINSNYNDSVVSVIQTELTKSYINEIKLNGYLNNILTLKLELLTERPKLLNCDVTASEISGINYLTFSKNCSVLDSNIIYTLSGTSTQNKDIIFEDFNGNKLFSGITFEVKSLVKESNKGTYNLTFKKYQREEINNSKWVNEWNTIQLNGQIDLQINDIIKLTKTLTPTITGSTYLMDNREFKISNIIYSSVNDVTILFTTSYIIDENNSEYTIYHKLNKNQIRTVEVIPSGNMSQFNDLMISDTTCHLTSNILLFNQLYISGSTNIYSDTIDAFISKFKTTFNSYGIDIYKILKNDEYFIAIESLYGTYANYFNVEAFTNGIKINDDFSLSNNGLTDRINIITNEKLINETTNRISEILYNKNNNSEILLNINSDVNKFGFILSINNIEYSINFIIDAQNTINSFIDTYASILENKGFIINSGYNYDFSGYTLNISSSTELSELSVIVNIFSTYKIIKHSINRSLFFNRNELVSNNVNFFDLNLATGMIIKINNSNYTINNKEYNILGLSENVINLSYQGAIINDYDVIINCSTRDFIRKPRGKYNSDVYFDIYWKLNSEEIIDETIFLYDISGTQLRPFNDNDAYKYIGQTPLIDSLENNIVFLNTEANKDIANINNPKYQQTVFNNITHKLEPLNSEISYNYIPEPMEIYIGYNCPIEGVNNRILKINKIEKLKNSDDYFSYSGYTNSGSSNSIPNFIFYDHTCEFNNPIDFNFKNYGFEKDQLIKFYFIDQSKTNQKIFENIYTYKIKDVTRNKIIIDSEYLHINDSFENYDTGYTYASSGFTNFNTTGSTFYFKIEVQPKEILSCSIYGQTEIEDIRYKVNLNNVGVQLEDDVYDILYDSDINDNAIDYILLNRKRKEMLTNYRDIYDYIGSYKSLINSINYFGYNDLQLYEYYRNIDQSSYLYGKLHKILIPDIFNNEIEGWNESDFIAGKYQNQNIWKKTNLFNLTYQITNENGDNVSIYSLEEVQYKLTKLKKWLRQNIIPTSANLLDITGSVDTNTTLYQDYDESNQTKKSVVERNSTVVNFNYTATLNFNSDYLVTVNFYILSGDTVNIPRNFTAKIKTFYLSGSTIENPTNILIPVQYLKINKNDLKPFSFNLNKNIDPYIYIETTTYDNDGCGLGYVNNKLFYFDEPRNYWIVNNNFDLTKMKYYQTTEEIIKK